jgi:hypothetical protein
MIQPIEQSDPSMAALDTSDEAAIEIATAVAEVYTNQVAKDYWDRRRRSQMKSKAESALFREAGEGIRRIKRGWSPISDREHKARSRDERERARKARNKRNQRARKPKSGAPAPVIAPVVITRDGFNDRLARLRVWLALPGHRQRHHRGREAEIMRSWVVYQVHLAQLGRRPSFGQFAGAFTARFDQPMTRPMAQNRLRLLSILMAAGGPLR